MTPLSQNEADKLLTMEKYYFDSEEQIDFPDPGGALHLPLYSKDKKEEFTLDITRGRISLQKHTFQTRARKTIILARLDLAGPPHRNPDGEELECPHLHLYREGYGDKWAFPLPEEFTGIDDAFRLLDVFMDYCAVIEKPTINRGLFT